MGTSKGYIAPTTPHWAKAKRGVTSYVGNPVDYLQKQAAANYARAMNTDGLSSGRVGKIFSDIASFASSSGSVGLNKALQDIGREDLLSMEPEDALNSLMLHFTEDGSTLDDAIALDCISAAFDILDVKMIEDLQRLGINRLLKELVCQFAKRKFAQLFDKQIRNKCQNIAQANSRIEEMQEYIYYTIAAELSDDVLSSINPHNLASEPIVLSILKQGFELMEHHYD